MVALLSIAAHKTGDREAAKELVQEAFISLYTRKDQIAPETPVRSYLYVILKHKLLNHYRELLVHQKYETHFSHSHSESDDSLQLNVETRELEKLINLEIDKLSPQCQQVFKMSRKAFMTNKEIALKLGISENTVEQHMRKALRLLRASLGQAMEISAVIYLIHHH